MKKMLLAVLFIALAVTAGSAQTTAVSLTAITDSDATVWANATWAVTFVTSPSEPNPANYKNNGSPVSPSVLTQNGTLNGSGTATITVYDNTQTFPLGSQWQIQLCPNATGVCATYVFIASGPTLDISTPINAKIVAPRFQPVSGNRGYVDVETISPSAGSTYFNVTSVCQKYYSGSTWACAGSAGSTISGQTSPCIPKASGATALTAPSSLCDDGTSINGTEPISNIPNVSVNSIALGYQQPLVEFFNGPMVSKTTVESGDSQTAVAVGAMTALCNRTNPGEELSGQQCVANSTYSIDGSKNVTVVVLGSIPSSCLDPVTLLPLIGAYISLDTSGTFSTNAIGTSTPTFQITAGTSNSFTFNNPNATPSISSTAANGVSSCAILNDGLNGASQAAFNVGSGVGSLAFINTIKPGLVRHIMGTNDVRLGTVDQPTLTALYKTFWDSIRLNSPGTMGLFLTPNSLLASDVSNVSALTISSTTSSTAGGPGSATITLAAMSPAIAGLITSDLTLAQEVANTQPTGSCATTGSITSGTAALTVASGTTCYTGMSITVAGAGGPFVITGGGTTVNLTIAPQATGTVVSAAVAQSSTVYSAHLIVDTGASQEIAPITNINLGASTVTVTFANAHSGTYAVTPTMATTAQAYTNILHDSTMSFMRKYPNVIVADTQTQVYGRLVKDTSSYMTNQLHPTGEGYGNREIQTAAYINKAKFAGGAKATSGIAGLPNVAYSQVADFSPMLARLAIDTNYAACWTNGNYQCIEHPQYYTLVGSGALNAYTSASFIRVTSETNVLTSNSSGFGIIPCFAGFDFAEIVGYGVFPVTTNCGVSTTFTQIGTTATIPANIPQTASYSAPVRVFRCRYCDPAAEFYVNSPGTYRQRRTQIVQAANGEFRVQASGADGNANVQSDNLVIGDTFIIIGSGLGAISCTSLTPIGTNQIQCNKAGTDFTGLTGFGFVFANGHNLGTGIATAQETLFASEFSNGTCTTAATIAPTNGNFQKITLTNADACALTFTQPVGGTTTSIRLKIVQSNVSTFNGTITGCTWAGGTPPVITASSAAVDVIRVDLDGAAAQCYVLGQNVH